MSGSHQRDRGALLALAFALAAIVVVAWMSNNPPRSPEGRPDADQVDKNAHSDISNAVSTADDFSFWEDPFPQWVMATFTIFATGISWLAVIYLKDTLRETRRAVKAADDAVTVTGDIGRAQTRAYLTCVEARLVAPANVTGNRTYWIEPRIVNSGQSPAMDIRFEASLLPEGVIPERPPPTATGRISIIGAGGVDEGRSNWLIFGSSDEIRNAISYSVRGTIFWTDVFKMRHETDFELIHKDGPRGTLNDIRGVVLYEMVGFSTEMRIND